MTQTMKPNETAMMRVVRPVVQIFLSGNQITDVLSTTISAITAFPRRENTNESCSKKYEGTYEETNAVYLGKYDLPNVYNSKTVRKRRYPISNKTNVVCVRQMDRFIQVSVCRIAKRAQFPMIPSKMKRRTATTMAVIRPNGAPFPIGHSSMRKSHV